MSYSSMGGVPVPTTYLEPEAREALHLEPPAGPKLLVVSFKHLPQTRRRGLIPSLFKLVRKESRVVADLVDVETKRPVNDTKHLSHESNIVFHETIMDCYDTCVKRFYGLLRYVCQEAVGVVP